MRSMIQHSARRGCVRLAVALGLCATAVLLPGSMSLAQAEQDLWLRIEQQVRLDTLTPTAMAVDPYGRVYLCDRNNKLHLLSPDLRLVRSVGGFGWGKEQFRHPVGLCAANGLDVFVCDYFNHRVERYDKDLNYIASLKGEDLEGEGSFIYPVSVDQSEQGDLFLLVRDPAQVIRFDSMGRPRLAFGGLEAGAGQLVDPIRLCLGDGKVYVLDIGTRSVRVFDMFGNYLGSLGEGELQEPQCLGWIPPELLVVADAKRGLLWLKGELASPIPIVPQPKGKVREVAASRGEVYLLLEGQGAELWRGRIRRLGAEE